MQALEEEEKEERMGKQSEEEEKEGLRAEEVAQEAEPGTGAGAGRGCLTEEAAAVVVDL